MKKKKKKKKKTRKKKKCSISLSYTMKNALENFIAIQKLMPKNQILVFLQSLSDIMKPTNKFNELLVTEKILDF